MIDCERLERTVRGMLITRLELKDGNEIHVMGRHPKSFREEIIIIIAGDADKIWGPDNESMKDMSLTKN